MTLLSVKYVAFLNFWVCGWNPLVWPLKWNVFRSAVLSHGTIYYLGEAPSKGFATLRNVPKLLFYGDRIGHSVRFRLSRPFDEVRAELVWDISRSLRVLYIISSGKPRQSHDSYCVRGTRTQPLICVGCPVQLIREIFLRPHFRRRHTFAPLWGACLRFDSCVRGVHLPKRFAKVWYCLRKGPVKRSSFKKFAESS